MGNNSLVTYEEAVIYGETTGFVLRARYKPNPFSQERLVEISAAPVGDACHKVVMEKYTTSDLKEQRAHIIDVIEPNVKMRDVLPRFQKRLEELVQDLIEMNW